MADEEFLKRWSRNKLTKEDKADGLDDIPQNGDEQAVLPNVPGDANEDGQSEAPPELPDIETLDGDSDYTPFLGENVPEDLARMALKKLWRSNPVFANLDGLNDYDEDYSKLGMVKMVVETAYKVGKGIVNEEDEDESTAELEEVVEEDEVEDEVDEIVADEEPEIAPDDEVEQLAEMPDQSVPHGEK